MKKDSTTPLSTALCLFDEKSSKIDTKGLFVHVGKKRQGEMI